MAFIKLTYFSIPIPRDYILADLMALLHLDLLPNYQLGFFGDFPKPE